MESVHIKKGTWSILHSVESLVETPRKQCGGHVDSNSTKASSALLAHEFLHYIVLDL